MVGTRNLDTQQKTQIMQKLLSKLNKNGRPMLGTINEIASEYNVSRKTITRLWQEVHKQMDSNSTCINLSNKRVGRQAFNKIQFDDEKFKSIKFELKGTQHSVAKQMEVSQSTVCRWKKDKIIRKHTNAIKPTLNDNNKVHRLSFALSKLKYDEHNDTFTFKPHTNIVHIDEKHFYLTRESQTYYLAPGEVEPHRECQSKRFIPKMMFMCAVANPIYLSNGGVFLMLR
jgi:DNA-binding XRE family transcriptional regulator